MEKNRVQYLAPGTVLCQYFRIEDRIGSGGMGDVYRVTDLRTESLFAIKIVRRDSPFGAHAHARMKREAELVTGLFHPNIVEVFETHFCDDGIQFLVMELLRGEDLQTLLLSQPRLSLSQTLSIVRPIISALHAAHSAGVVHRDVKPSNIFLATSDATKGPIPKLLDFGLARRLADRHGEKGLTRNLVVGTVEYLSPEATEPSQTDVDARSDQWSLAVLIFRMITGHLPFDHPDPLVQCWRIRTRDAPPLTRYVGSVPQHVCAALHRALKKNKQDRFPTVLEFLRALEGRPGASVDELDRPFPQAVGITNPSVIQSPSVLLDDEPTRPLILPGWVRGAAVASVLGAVGLCVSLLSFPTKSVAKRSPYPTMPPQESMVRAEIPPRKVQVQSFKDSMFRPQHRPMITKLLPRRIEHIDHD